MAFKDAFKQYWLDTGTLNVRRFKRFVLSAPFWILIIAAALIATGIIRYNILIDNRPEQYMADIWSQESNVSYRQLSVFARGVRSTGTLPVLLSSADVSITRADVATMRKELQGIVDSSKGGKSAGLTDDGSPRGWEDAYSTFFDTSVYRADLDGEPKDSDRIDAQIVAVGGNYGLFHPFIYMSGGFLQDRCVDPDQIVLNDALAWRLFKSYDITGRRIVLDGHEFIVSGVVREYDSSIDREVEALEPRAYIYFNALEVLVADELSTMSAAPADATAAAPDGASTGSASDASSSTSSSTPTALAISCYEVMLPEIVEGVANTDIKSVLPGYTETNPKYYVLSNTERFGVLKVWDYMIPFGETSVQLNGYEMPYWERACQITYVHLFVDMVLVFAGSFLLVVGVAASVLRWRKKDFDIIVPEEETEDSEEETALAVVN